MTIDMSLPIDDEVMHGGVLAQLAAAGDSAAPCASCLIAALEVGKELGNAWCRRWESNPHTLTGTRF